MIKYGREYRDEELIFGEPIWFIESIWGSGKYLVPFLNSNKVNNIKEFFDALPVIFSYYIGDEYVTLTNWRDRELWNKIPWINISNYEAYLIFGLALMENACEKTSSELDLKIFYKETRKIKLNKLKTNKHESEQ